MATQKPTIFISYRRADHPDFVERIRDWFITNGYDDERVFMDLSNMPYFTAFAEFIREKVLESEVVIVIIGPQWLEHLRERAIRDETDYVRLEIAIALEQDKLVAPICIKGAKMPSAKDLQDFPDLQAITRYHAPELDAGRQFLKNITDIIGAVEAELERRNNKKGTPLKIEVIEPQPAPSKSSKIEVWDILPQPFEWCEIPAGKVTLEDASSDGGTTGGTFEVPTFLMAKYPITNAQYEVFVTAQDGYAEAKWWDYSTEAQAWRHKRQLPESTAFEGDDLPRTNVGRTTPVTQYPKGVSPYGVMDMAGNVWVWCLTEWGTDSVDISGNKSRVGRGGSWWSNLYEDDLRAAFRFGSDPDWIDGDRGIRVSLSS